MSRLVWILIATSGVLTGCSGAPPSRSGAAQTGSAADQCGVCQFENPGNPDACAQACLASGQWVRYGPTPPQR